MSERNNTDLVVNALVMALARRDPDGELVITRTGVRPTHRWSSPTGSPTGISTRLTARPVTAMTTPRWNRSGRPSKREIIHIHGGWESLTRSELRTILFDYIEVFYNRARHQARLEHHTPAEAYAASAA